MSADSESGTDNSQYPTKKEMQRRSSDLARLSATAALERTRTASRTASSGLLALLARRMGRSVEEIAEKIPEDTIRRSKYPVTIVENDDGTMTFKHIVAESPDKQLVHAPTSPGGRDKQSVERGGVHIKH